MMTWLPLCKAPFTNMLAPRPNQAGLSRLQQLNGQGQQQMLLQPTDGPEQSMPQSCKLPELNGPCPQNSWTSLMFSAKWRARKPCQVIWLKQLPQMMWTLFARTAPLTTANITSHYCALDKPWSSRATLSAVQSCKEKERPTALKTSPCVLWEILLLAQYCPMPCAADKFQSSAIPKIERGTLRVAAPFEYRQQYVDRDSAQKVLTCMANWPHDLRAETLAGGRWSKQWVGPQSQQSMLVCFLKLPTAAIGKLLPFSGQHGIFLNAIGENQEQQYMKWFPRNKLEPSAYLQESRAAAKAAQQILHFRKNDQSNLGIQCKAEDRTTPLRIIARGVPQGWEAEELHHMLRAQSWSLGLTSKSWTIGRKAATSLNGFFKQCHPRTEQTKKDGTMKTLVWLTSI